jgi:hypothetical protein
VLSTNTILFTSDSPTRLCTVATIINDDVSEESPEFFLLQFRDLLTERVTNCRTWTRIRIFDDDGGESKMLIFQLVSALCHSI